MKKTVKRSRNDLTNKSKKKQIKISTTRSLTKLRHNVAGIDVGSEFHYIAAPDPDHEGKIVVNRFGSFTTNLRESVELLKRCKIESAAMEATGVYWQNLYTMLTDAGIEVVLINPRNFKKIKDKKTDVCDCEQLQIFHSYGLLEGSVIPEKSISELRTYVKLRDQSIMDSATSIQRMQKALIQMNLRLDKVLSDVSGVTGMKIIQAILNGERDQKVLAKHRDPKCKKSQAEIEESLNGFYQEDQLFALERAMKDYEHHLRAVRECDSMIAAKLKAFDTKQPLENEAKDETEQKPSPRPKKGKKKLKNHEFSFDLHAELIRITGVNLTLLPGIGVSTALTLISETGLDMTKWPSCKHFASWLGLVANNQVSGGKILRNRTKPKKKKAAITLRMCVSSLHNEVNDTALGAFYRRKRAQMGAPKAITAAARKLACMYYMTLSTGKVFKEMGAQAYYDLQKDKYLRKIRRQVEHWGYEVTPIKLPCEELEVVNQ